MGPARAIERYTHPLPAQHTVIPLNRTFTADEMRQIRMGYVPRVMEDKWLVYWKDNELYFHRSWTGYCIYVVRFVNEGETWRMVEARVNRDPSQYLGTQDERDARLISYLIDVLLLRRPETPFPTDRPPELAALEMWSVVGRAAYGEYPPREEEDDADSADEKGDG